MDRLLNTEEVANALHTSVANVRWLRHKGDLPTAAKIGNRLAWRASDIAAYIEAQFDKASA